VFSENVERKKTSSVDLYKMNTVLGGEPVVPGMLEKMILA
jgi:hypothetical protein